ncbi:hypothetical protein ACFL0Q_07240, partial [Thermodesulfobacteriota bacterium]
MSATIRGQGFLRGCSPPSFCFRCVCGDTTRSRKRPNVTAVNFFPDSSLPVLSLTEMDRRAAALVVVTASPEETEA